MVRICCAILYNVAFEHKVSSYIIETGSWETHLYACTLVDSEDFQSDLPGIDSYRLTIPSTTSIFSSLDTIIAQLCIFAYYCDTVKVSNRTNVLME